MTLKFTVRSMKPSGGVLNSIVVMYMEPPVLPGIHEAAHESISLNMRVNQLEFRHSGHNTVNRISY
jgi:hypothetical protein